MVTGGEGRLLSAEPIAEAVRAVEPFVPAAFSINCVPARRLGTELARLAAAAPGWALAAYGNLGLPGGELGSFTDDLSPDQYAALAREWLASGARLVGGCCGTTSAYTSALARTLRRGGPCGRPQAGTSPVSPTRLR